MHPGDFTLERMRWLMQALDTPQQSYSSLHVAGTNGKGSVSALCAAGLQAAGHRVGLFTSPHLHGALEGIQVDGRVVPTGELDAAFERLRPHLKARTDWTHFEVVTALAFQHFALAGVNAAVIEVGLGGRLDATNVLTPTVSVITPIDLDHTSILGDSLAAIAGEKAGILKPGVPAVSAPQAPEAAGVIRRKAAEIGASLIEVGLDYLYKLQSSTIEGQALGVWRRGTRQVADLSIGLLGDYQAENAATAYTALQVACENGLQVSTAAIQKGFAAAEWPGRFEVLQTQPPLVLDAAHSPHAARALRRALDEYFPAQPAVIALGVSVDKDLAGIIEALHGRIEMVIATQAAHPRAMQALELQRRLAGLGLEVQAQPDPAQALQMILDAASPREDETPVALVCGSVFLVEQMREIYLHL